MNEKRQIYLLLGCLSLAIFLLAWSLSLLGVREGSFYDRIDKPLQDLLFRVRNHALEPQPISREVTLVGIDDQTTGTLGRYGEGVWKTRLPFMLQLHAFMEHQPSVVAYDIVFKEDTEAWDDYFQRSTEAVDLEELGMILARKGRENEPIREIDLLRDISLIATRQANDNLAVSFSEVAYADTDQPVQIIFGYYFQQESTLGGDRHGERRRWTQADILGDDPEWLSEDSGLTAPYLRDVGIPLRLVSGPLDAVPFYKLKPILPTPQLIDVGLLGFIQAPRDPDGVVRRYPLVCGMQYSFEDPTSGERVERRFLLPSLALLACMYHLGIDLVEHNLNDSFTAGGKAVVEVVFGRHVILRPPGKPEIRVPIDEQGLLFLDYVGTIEDYDSISFVGSLRGDRERVREALHGKIVFIGSTETGGTDVGPVPVSSHSALVLVHMTAASNILQGIFIRPLREGAVGVLMAVLWLLLAPGAMFLRPRLFTICATGLVFIYLAVAFWLVAAHLYVLPISAPVSAILFTTVGTVLFRYFTEEKEKQKIRGMFSTMVSEDVLDYMEDHPESFSLAGERREATMLFSDVAGFTTISEKLPPDRLSELLNAYLSPMTDIIMSYRGYVDKYEGDAIMADWGVPFPNPDHARDACYAALDQQRCLAELRPKLKERFQVDLHVRMGINSGAVSAGNMGSTRKFQYTVMGDAVNQAARYEPANKDYNTLIMIGESTWLLAREHIEARLLDRIIVKGKSEPIQIYELFAKRGEASPEMLRIVELYEKGLRAHWERQWDDALALWAEVLALRPDDGPSLALSERVRGYQDAPPPPTWRGEYVRQSKD